MESFSADKNNTSEPTAFRPGSTGPLTRILLENAGAGITLYDTSGKVLYVNSPAATLLKSTPQELKGKNVLEFMPEQEAREFLSHIQDAARQEDACSYERQMKTPQGQAWFLSTFQPVFDANGIFSGVQVISQEITLLKQAEAALEESENRFRTVADFTYDWEYWVGPDGRWLYNSPSCQNITGYAADLFYKNADLLLDIVHPEDRSMVEAHLKETASNSNPGQIRFRIVHADTSIHWIEHVCIEVRDSEGILLGRRASNRDVSEKIVIEQHLADALEFNQKIIYNSSLGIRVFKDTGQCVLANEAAAKTLEIPVEQLLKQNYLELGFWKNSGLLDVARAALESNTTHNGLANFTTPSGRNVWVDYSMTTFTSKGERHLLVIYSDITGRREVEEAEREQRTLAEALRDTSAALNSTLDFDLVLDLILVNVGKVVPHDVAYISLLGENNQVHMFRSRTEPAPKASKRSSLRSPSDSYDLGQLYFFQQMMQTGLPMLISNTRAEPRWLKIPGWGDMLSYLGAPVVVQGNAVGFLSLCSTLPNFFTVQHKDRLKAFADQAAVAIQNARLYSEARKLAREAEARQAVGMALNSTLDFSQILTIILEQIRYVLSFDSASILLVGEDELTVEAASGFKNVDELIGTHYLLNEDNPNFEVVRQRCPVIVDNIKQQYPKFRQDVLTEIKSWMGIPLFSKDQVIGMLNLDSREINHFTVEDERVAIGFAAQAAIALENARLFSQTQQLALVDALTGLYNRRHFFNLAEIEVARSLRYHQSLCAIMIDIDHFKQVNDTFGHKVGDLTLQTIAQKCSQNLRVMDLIGRYGGEEFVVALPETRRKEAFLVAERIRQTIASTEIDTPRGKVHVTASLGIAGLTDDYRTLDALLDCADQAMYVAKKAGRNCVSIFQKS